MTPTRLTIFVALPSALLFWACEGVGTPLVDVDPPHSPMGGGGCLPLKECDPDALVEDVARNYVTEPVVLENCQASDPPISNAMTCADLRWPEDELATGMELSGFTLKRSNLVIETTTPYEVVLEGAALDDVWIALRGPVTLRVLARSRVVRSRIQLTNDAGEPRIVFEDSEAQNLVVTSADDTRVGSVSLSRGLIERSLLAAREVDLHSVVQFEVAVDADRFTATDLIDTSGRFAVTEGLIASSLLASARLTRCGQFTIVDTTLVNSALGPCSDGPLRLYTVNLLEGFVDGPVESDETDWSLMRVGARAPTSVLSWDSAFGSVHFCEQTAEMRFGEQSSLTCSRCDNRKDSEVTCTLPDDYTFLSNVDCDPLIAERTCLGNLPSRARPR